MKQLLHNLSTGSMTMADVPLPNAAGSQLVVESHASLISAGTERMLVDFGRARWLEKARQQPERIAQVLQKARTDGIGPTIEAVRAKLDQPMTLGYCQAGVVVDAGQRAAGQFTRGDRVATNGPHAEYVRVPMTLAAKVPDAVSFESASFTPLAAVALQGIRLAELAIGETVVVFGLGLVGLLTVQLVRANGCHVIGIDPDPSRRELASRFGAEALPSDDAVAAHVISRTRGIGCDAVLLTLSADSNEPIHQAADMSRVRGRLILVGVTGLGLRREDFYRKELRFGVSSSYGPGRYDPRYEDDAIDYPPGYVRWTAQRNFEAVLALMADGRLDPTPLISHRFAFSDASAAYDIISREAPSLGVLLEYEDRGGRAPDAASRTIDRRAPRTPTTGSAVVVGAGNYASRILLPAAQRAGFQIRSIATSGGAQGAIAGEKFDADRVTTDLGTALTDPLVDTVFVVTRHDSHARIAIAALDAGKHVFVEKPLALQLADVEAIERAATRAKGLLTVGFNRRFAPLAREVATLIANRSGPAAIVVTVNAGAIARSHWTQDPAVGGGRIVGEAVHWIDLCRALAGAPIASLHVATARSRSGDPIDDIAHLTLQLADGCTAVIHYVASGSPGFPKERIEVFYDGKTVVIDNWRRLRRFGVPGPLFERARRMDKGHDAELAAWVGAVKGEGSGNPPIPLSEVFEVSRWAIRAAELARQGGGAAS